MQLENAVGGCGSYKYCWIQGLKNYPWSSFFIIYFYLSLQWWAGYVRQLGSEKEMVTCIYIYRLIVYFITLKDI